MKSLLLRLALPVMLGVMIAGCATSERKVNLKEASRANAEAGVLYLRQGNLRDSKEKLDEALQQDSNNVTANWTMGSLLEQLDRPAEADRFYKTAMRLQPDNPDIANTYAVYLCKSGKSDEALPLFDALIRNKLYREPWAAATNAAVCLRSDKRHADALAYLERGLTMRANYVDAVIQKADVQLELGRSSQAKQTVDAYLAVPKPKENDPHRPEVLLVGVRAALADRDRQAAENYARLLARDFPSSPLAATAQQLLKGAK